MPGVYILLPAALSALDVDRIVTTLRGEVQPKAAMERMRRVYATDRWFTFPRFQETRL